MPNDFLKTDIDAANRSDTRIRWIKFGIGLALVSALVFGAISWAGSLPEKDRTDAVPLAAYTDSDEPAYQYAYLEQTCQSGIQKYEKVFKQLQAELDKVQVLMTKSEWRQNPANIEAAKAVLLSNQAVMEESGERVQRLESCLDAVAEEVEFTDEQVADLKAIASDIPAVSSQPTYVAGVSISTFDYTPYDYQYEPLDYGNFDSNFDSGIANDNTYYKTPEITYSSPAPRQSAQCNQQLKAAYTSSYEAARADLGRQREAERRRVTEDVASSGTSSSGLGRQRVNDAVRSYDSEARRLEQNYQRQLASINCD